MKSYKKIQNISLLLALFCLQSILGQFEQDPGSGIPLPGSDGELAIIGPSTVNINETHTYYASASGVTVFSGIWSSKGATIVTLNATSAEITWASSGSKQISYTATDSTSGILEATYFVDVNGASAPAPPANSNVAIALSPAQTCNSASLERVGVPTTTEVLWYWQGTNSNGTNASNSNLSDNLYPITTTGRYYLRAKNTSDVWSVGSAYIDVTIGIVGGTTWYDDADRDLLGDPDPSKIKIQCTQPLNYVDNSDDQCPDDKGLGTTTGCSLTTSGLSKENYVYTIVPQVPTTNTSTLTETKDVVRSVTYFDGLGRAKQNVGIKQSTNEKDIVTHIEYDALGRKVKEYLPYASTTDNGIIKTGAQAATNTYYELNYSADIDVNLPNPFSEKEFDGSPLNRVLKQAAPGKAWKLGSGHEIAFDYHSNTISEVREYYVTTSFSNKTYTATLQLNISKNSGYYSENELYKTITKDENHDGSVSKLHTTEEFKNKQGQVVLKRTYALVLTLETAHDTYYVYDDFGNLTYVLPPLSESGSAKPGTMKLAELCYQYKYDYRKRLVEKKIPGKGWEYIIYDKLDRPVLTQDANLRSVNNNTTADDKKWLFTKYDVLGRVVYTGLYTHGSVLNQSEMQTHFDTQNNVSEKYFEEKLTTTGALGVYYTNSDFPTTSLEVFTVNYYDNYTFDRAGTGISINAYGVNSTTILKGLATGSKVKVLGESPVKWITTVSYYDEKARPIYIYSKNDFLLSTDIIKSKLDFVGKVEETISTHTKTDDNLPTITLTDKFVYDHVGRLTKQTQQGTNITGIEVITENTYDELGQLKRKDVGGTTIQPRLQNIDYTYNVRGWLKEINKTSNIGGDLFAFKLNYNTVEHGADDLFNGNIAETEWKTKNDNQLRWYKYSYDALNRLEKATDDIDRYSLSNVDYDKNGNITKLKRKGHIVENPDKNISSDFNVMDDLTYTYTNGNKLMGVSDAIVSASVIKGEFKDDHNSDTPDLSNDYTYDVNGNMKTDANKGITNIIYNHLSLPTQVTIGGQSINYIYDATGTKLRKSVSNVITDYAGNFIYKKTGTASKVLEFFNHPEGYVKNDNGTFNYVYQYKDHLGNVRLSYAKNGATGSLDIIEESNYYPFGLKHKGYNTVMNHGIGNSTAQKFGFGGKELNDDLVGGNNLNWHDFGARNYDAALGRWMNLDPLAEKYNNLSPYNYVAGNPIIFKDPDGKKIIIGNFSAKKLTNLAQIAATKKGRALLSRLIKSKSTFRYKSTFLSQSSNYDPNTNTIYSVGSPILPSLEGGSTSSSMFAAHEFSHADDHNSGIYPRDGAVNTEKRAVKFANYMRSVHGKSRMRRTYSNIANTGKIAYFSKNEKSYNKKEEKVTNFETVGFGYSKEKETSYGVFSFESSSKNEEKTTSYLVIGSSKENGTTINVYNTQKEYEEALKNNKVGVFIGNHHK